MNRINTLLVMCLTAIAATAQVADVEISYTMVSPNMRTGNLSGITNQYILIANSQRSKFYSPQTEYLDSLNSTPEGKAKYQQMIHSSFFDNKDSDMLKKDGSMYVMKDISDKVIYTYDTAGSNKYVTEETLNDIQWKIVDDSVKICLGYKCMMATADFHGRKWTAWFSTELPIMNGPWKLGGLPGIILEAECESNQYRFVANGIQKTRRVITPIYLKDSYEYINRIAFLKAKRSFIDNPFGAIDAQTEGEVTIESTYDESGNVISENERLFVTREVVDFIETDY